MIRYPLHLLKQKAKSTSRRCELGAEQWTCYNPGAWPWRQQCCGRGRSEVVDDSLGTYPAPMLERELKSVATACLKQGWSLPPTSVFLGSTCYKLLLVQRITDKMKKIRKIVQSSSDQCGVCEFDSNELARSVSDGTLQDPPHPTPVTPVSRVPSVFAQFKGRQRQEPNGAPCLANHPASVENEGLSTSFQEVWIYISASWV